MTRWTRKRRVQVGASCRDGKRSGRIQLFPFLQLFKLVIHADHYSLHFKLIYYYISIGILVRIA